MSEQPTHAMLVRADDGSLHHRPACTSRECAERTITFAEGGQVVGVTYLYPEPIPGVQFWSAVQLGNAPKTAADSSSQWRPIAEAPKGGGAEYTTDPTWIKPPSVLLYCGDGSQVVGYWEWYYAEDGAGFRGGSAWVENSSGELVSGLCGEPTHFQLLPAPPATGDQP